MKEEVTLNKGKKGRMKQGYNKAMNKNEGYPNCAVGFNVETKALNN